MKGSFAMTWSISHGGTKLGYSYSGIHDLGQLLLRKATAADAENLRLIFRPRSGDPFEFEPWQAEAVGMALRRTARRLGFLHRSRAEMAEKIADSALLASSTGEHWRWS